MPGYGWSESSEDCAGAECATMVTAKATTQQTAGENNFIREKGHDDSVTDRKLPLISRAEMEHCFCIEFIGCDFPRGFAQWQAPLRGIEAFLESRQFIHDDFRRLIFNLRPDGGW
jgi:hypothetical protein